MFRVLLALFCFASALRAEDFLPGVQRILFLGDSITHAGQYVDDFELYLAVHHPERKITVINCGLPSETVSGLSEAGHAGGKFPRPDLHERLDRVLATVKPQLVFACYGMNCGIYLPLHESRFARYRDGIEKLRAKVKAAGAEIIHLTPAYFDALPIKDRVVLPDRVKDGEQSANYDEVLTRYSEWLVAEGKSQGWRVIDVHCAMADAVQQARQSDPTFTFAKDGVHPNHEGHHVIAGALLRGLGVTLDPAKSEYAALLAKVRQRGRVLTDAYLHAAGHQRPGMAKGLPIEEALEKAAEIETTFPKVTP